jgi:anti-sigma factor RsiW
MTQSVPITDEELVAYLDGALDQARRRAIDAALERDEVLAARLAKLDIDTDAIRAIFGRIEDAAPVDRLRSRLDEELSRRRSRPSVRRQWMRIAATLLLGVGVGIGAATVLSGVFDKPPSWRAAVADYHALYTGATLASAGNGSNLGGEVASVSAKLELPIALDALKLPGLDFKRAQLLQFEGRPLAQFAYLSEAGVPMAFCFMRTGNADRPIQVSTLHGLAAASWTKNGYGFIMIGGTQSDVVRQAATELASRI